MDDVTLGTKTMLDAAVAAHMPVMLVGSPGTGKTATVKAMAKERDYKLITLVGSRMDPTDVSGLPKGVSYGEDENGQQIDATVYLSPHWQVEILREKKVILFLDEWGNSPTAIQAAFLTILQDREFANGHKFPDETIIIGATNSVDEGADGYEMSLPTTNRIFWISWNPTLDSWVKGMQTAWGADVPDEELAWKHKIARFIKDNPTWLHQLPKDAPTNEVYGLNPNNSNDMTVFRSAWASRRSWDNLSRVLANTPEDTYLQDTIAQGVVGYAATAAFRDWLRQNDVVSPHEVIKDPSIVDWKKVSVNDVNLIFRAVNELVTEENSLQVIALFDHVADAGRANLAGPFLTDIFKKVMSEKFSKASMEANKKAILALTPKYRSVTKKVS